MGTILYKIRDDYDDYVELCDVHGVRPLPMLDIKECFYKHFDELRLIKLPNTQTVPAAAAVLISKSSLKTIFSILVFFHLALSTKAQGYEFLPDTSSVIYDVPYSAQSDFTDSLFTELRKAGFREIKGNGELSHDQVVIINKQAVPYGVVVFYNAKQIIIGFYAQLPSRKKDLARQAIKRDFISRMNDLNRKPRK